MKTIHTFGLLTVFLIFCSCGKDNPVESQGTAIESYIKAKMNRNQELKLSRQGAVSYLYAPGDTTTAVASGDSIYFFYDGVLLADTLKCFDTNKRATAEALGLNGSRNFEPVGIRAGDGKLMNGLNIGLLMVHNDDVGEIIFNSDLGFGNKRNGIVPAYSPLVYKISTVQIKKNQ